MKKTINIILYVMFLFSPYLINGQQIKIKTNYTKLEDSYIGPEEYEFTFSNDFLVKKNVFRNNSDRYPSIFEDSFYDKEGGYCETYSPVSYIKNHPIEWSDNYSGDLRLYKIVYNKRGGHVLYIMEIIGRNTSNMKIKYYLTDLGKSIFSNN